MLTTYSTIDFRPQPVNTRPTTPELNEPIYDPNLPSCSSSTYGRIGNTYGRIDIIGHGIGRIERHLSSSCGSINSNHYALESLYGTSDRTGKFTIFPLVEIGFRAERLQDELAKFQFSGCWPTNGFHCGSLTQKRAKITG